MNTRRQGDLGTTLHSVTGASSSTDSAYDDATTTGASLTAVTSTSMLAWNAPPMLNVTTSGPPLVAEFQFADGTYADDGRR